MLTCIERGFLADGSHYTVRRSAAGYYTDKGRWVEGTTSEFTALGVVEPLRVEEIDRLEDSRHVKGAFRFYTLTQLNKVSPDGAVQPDVVTIKGLEYEVEGVWDWEVHGAGYRVIVVRREMQSDASS